MAAGLGTRMGNKVPKQFIEILGKPIIAYTLYQFKAIENLKTIIVLPKKNFLYWKNYLSDTIQDEKIIYAKGGNKRFISVKNGLKKIKDNNGIVAIHDGVRPMLSNYLINNLFDNAEKLGNAIPFTPIINSLRKVKGGENKAVNRENYVNIQTPQVFKIKIINDSLKKARHSDYNDEASLIEETGHKINLIKGEQKNIKLTDAIDLEYFKKKVSNIHLH